VIDWNLVRRIAETIGGQGGTVSAPRGDLAAIADDSQRRVLAYTQLSPMAELPTAEMVSRQQWIESNLRSMRPVLDRVGARVGGGMGVLGRPTRAVTRALFSAQVGGLTGFLAQRVLGQYDMPLLDSTGAPRLLLVGPNLGAAALRLEADGEQLLHWVTLHEMTHAVQFGSVPWLRLHLAALVREVVDTLDVRIDTSRGLRVPSTADLRELIESLRKGELVTLVIGRERRGLVDRIQATMAVIEGHAEHVMDAVGAEVIPSQATLRAALERRRMARSGPMRLLERVLGFELKMRQYRDGKRFCDAVVERIGIEGFNRVWSAPQALPTLAELVDPDAWIARTAVPFVTK
jgi:coenzyme F420 biosynthesis associated uncharacterized protein